MKNLTPVPQINISGHDTVSSSMGFTVYMIAHHPHIQNKIFEELKGIMEDSEVELTHEDIGRMKYLEQCIKEALRMFPTVPIIGRYMDEDTVVGDFTVPKGVTVMVAPFAVQRVNLYENNEKVKLFYRTNDFLKTLILLIRNIFRQRILAREILSRIYPFQLVQEIA